ncbi:MAG: hypothetical protein KJZ81_06445 [Burkholderiaceae bacterium]|jgi:hypothetical protein|nr:hypothetical protein [Burkholderiaceae bacterium]
MKKRFAPWSLADRTDAPVVRSHDGLLAFRVQGLEEGVYVERMLTHRRTARVTQAGVFRDRASFDRWCDADPTRFSDPNLHWRLRQAIDRMFAADDARHAAR